MTHSQIYESALGCFLLDLAEVGCPFVQVCDLAFFDIGSLRKVLQSNPCPILLILNLNLLNLREVIRYLFLVEPIPKNKGQSPDLDKWTSVHCHIWTKINFFFTRNYRKKYQGCIKIRPLCTIATVKHVKEFIWVLHL